MAPSYPYPGCIVEYMEDNLPHIGMVIEDAGGKLRLLLPNRREVKLSANRILPWLGPTYSAGKSKEEILQILEQHRKYREDKAVSLSVLDAWELAQGEIQQASANWFAELMEDCPDEDTVAAYGRALLVCKTHFRFNPPEFLVFDKETVTRREEEQAAKREKEILAAQGSSFIRLLWDVANKRKQLPPEGDAVYPPKELADRIRRLLHNRMNSPESQEDESLWQLISKGLPEEPHIPARLLMAWGVLPPHYNFWLDRADYERGDSWWRDYADEVEELAAGAAEADVAPAPGPFISIDGPATIDIDDAFAISKTEDGWSVSLAFANPARNWPFGGGLDKLVARRATSIYLPEGDLHMLPEKLGTNANSLLEDQPRPAFILNLKLDEQGECQSCEPTFGCVRLAANLRYADAQKVIAGQEDAENPASLYRDQIKIAHELGVLRENLRIANGAVVMLRHEPHIALSGEGEDITVSLDPEGYLRDAQRLVSELMILASGAIADWAFERAIPLLHRTQYVALPREYAGVWENPADLAKIMRALIPSSLETTPRPHAALGLRRYAQVTSPLRRYSDLVNEAQIIHYLKNGASKWNEEELREIGDNMNRALEGAGHAQRFRPRYWKLLYFRQQGEKTWYDGIITEENESMTTVCLPKENIMVRGRRNLFDERAAPGMPVRLRLGKIQPLLNDIHILETMPDE